MEFKIGDKVKYNARVNMEELCPSCKGKYILEYEGVKYKCDLCMEGKIYEFKKEWREGFITGIDNNYRLSNISHDTNLTDLHNEILFTVYLKIIPIEDIDLRTLKFNKVDVIRCDTSEIEVVKVEEEINEFIDTLYYLL